MVFVLDTSLAVELAGLGGYVGAFDAMLEFVESVTDRLQVLLAAQRVKTDAAPLVNVGAVLFEERSLGYPQPPSGKLGVALTNVTEGLLPMLNYSTVRMSLLRPMLSFGPTKTDTALEKARSMITTSRRQVSSLTGASVPTSAAVVVIAAGQSLNGAPTFSNRQPEIAAELEGAFWHEASVCRHAVGTGRYALAGAEPTSKATVVQSELALLGDGSFTVMEGSGTVETVAQALAQCTTPTLVEEAPATTAPATTPPATTTTTTSTPTTDHPPAVTTTQAVPNATTTEGRAIATAAPTTATAAPKATEPPCAGNDRCKPESGSNFCGAISWDNVINCDSGNPCICHDACVFFGAGACCADFLEGGCN